MKSGILIEHGITIKKIDTCFISLRPPQTPNSGPYEFRMYTEYTENIRCRISRFNYNRSTKTVTNVSFLTNHLILPFSERFYVLVAPGCVIFRLNSVFP